MDESEIGVIATSSSLDEVSEILNRFLIQNSNVFTFQTLNKNDCRTLLWTGLFQHIQNERSDEIHALCLAVIRLISRDKTDLDKLLCEKWITTLIEKAGLYNYDGADDNCNGATALPDKEIVIEALKCLCNLAYNSEVAREHCADTSIAQGLIGRVKAYKDISYKDEIMLFDMKLIFILTALRHDLKVKIKYELHGMENLTTCLSDIVLESSKSDEKKMCGNCILSDEKQTIVCQILKAQFNLILQSSLDETENKNEDEEGMFLQLMPVLTALLCAQTTDTNKSMELKSNVANLLTCVPPIYYVHFTPKLEKEESSKYTFEGCKMDAMHALLSFLQYRLSITIGVHNQYENLSPILTVLNKAARGSRIHRKYLRQEVLPPLRDVSKPPEKGSTLRNQLCRLLTTPVTSVRDLVAEFLFILCKEKVGRMVKYTGFGNAAGHLAQKGLLCGGGGAGYSSSDDSDTDEYVQAAPHIDPVVGCTRPPRDNPFHGMSEQQVIWNAPSTVADTCVRLCARVGPASGAKTWSVLARKICPTSVVPSTVARQPPIVEPCCACDEAKYEVTFEGLWSRGTHPREFPPESAHAHFGDLIGASHTAQYRVWQEGRVASTGLRRLADDGATTALEKELKAESDHIRTIIKARGISWQQVAGGNNPSTFAVFRVDAKHHLVSLAAKLAPSPDWIVGVSALELCNANCTWRRSATLPLFPYDAGTDSGISYTSRRMPTIPAAPVRALRPDWPRDARSPFFSTNAEMRPFARLRLTRLRLYEKSCDAAEPGNEHVPEIIGSSIGGACATHAWGAWGPCSVTCGPGRAMRQRQYMWPVRARVDACRTPLTDYKRCYGPRMHCRAPSEYEPDPAESSGPCAVSEWSPWSPCEGCGVRGRSRHYLVPRAHKRCHVGYRARVVMDQAMPCDAGPCEKPTGQHVNATNFDWFFVDNPGGECAVTGWGGWSPCSARCGRGRRVRARLYVARDPRLQPHLTRTLLHSWNQRFAYLQKIESPQENVTADDPEIEALVQEHLEKCQFTLTLQEALCDGEDESCANMNLTSADICKMPISVGHCRGYEERWFYDAGRNSCEPFGYSGCGGNNNNFRTRDLCIKTCHSHPTANTGNLINAL